MGKVLARALTASGMAVLTAGAYTITIGVAAKAEAPRIEAPLMVSASRPPDDVTPPMLPPAGLDRSEPVAIAIPRIRVDATLGQAGIGPDGRIEVPPVGPTYDQPAWYRYSPTPGEEGPAVIEGHLDTPEGKPSVFYYLAQLEPGNEIDVTRADGKILTFVITQVGRYAKADFPTDAVYGNLDHPGLRLLTCGGSLDENGNYRDNVVVFATLSDVSDAVVTGTSERTGYGLSHDG